MSQGTVTYQRRNFARTAPSPSYNRQSTIPHAAMVANAKICPSLSLKFISEFS